MEKQYDEKGNFIKAAEVARKAEAAIRPTKNNRPVYTGCCDAARDHPEYYRWSK